MHHFRGRRTTENNYEDVITIVPITKREAMYFAATGSSYKNDIMRTINGRSYFLKESEALMEKLTEYRKSVLMKK